MWLESEALALEKYIVTMTLDALAWVAFIVLGGIMILASRAISESSEGASREKQEGTRFVAVTVGLFFILLAVVALITGDDIGKNP